VTRDENALAYDFFCSVVASFGVRARPLDIWSRMKPQARAQWLAIARKKKEDGKDGSKQQ